VTAKRWPDRIIDGTLPATPIWRIAHEAGPACSSFDARVVPLDVEASGIFFAIERPSRVLRVHGRW
jgi:hypothetical protein